MEKKEDLKNEKIDYKFINSEFQKNEIGYANIFFKYYNGKIIVLNIKNKYGYIWNSETCLYDEICEGIIIPKISNVLQELVNLMIIAVRNNDVLDEKDIENKVKDLTHKKFLFGSTTTTKNVYNFLFSLYLDDKKVLMFDNMENIIAIQNKQIINLKTGKIENRTTDHLFTKEQNNTYLGKGDQFSPKTKQFFMELSCNNDDKYNLLRLVFGSSITSDVMMKCFFILYGAGDNGKSLLLSIMEIIFHNQFLAISPTLLFSEKKDKVSNVSYGSLIGKTIGCCGEPDLKYINGAIIKSLTGGDAVEGKKLYCNPVSFVPVAKILIYLNNVIQIEDDAVMRKRTVVM